MTERHLKKLNKQICDQISPKLYECLIALGVTGVLDIAEFEKEEGYSPCVGSIFIIPGGGTYDFVYHTRVYDVYNGGLSGANIFSSRYNELLKN